MKKTLSYFAAILMVIAAMSSCSKNKKTVVSEGTKNQILHYGNGTEVSDLDPHIVTGVPEHHILTALFEGLVSRHPETLDPTPGMAESWEISKDGKHYTFHIRKDAKWSNGDELNANDFVYSWKRLLSPALASEYSYMLHYLKNAKAYNDGKLKDFSKVGVKATDKYTLKVELENPTPFFLSLLAHYSAFPVHQATVEKFGKIDTRGTKWTRPENMVSNGPFVLKKWELNKIVTVEKNPTYWDAKTVKLNGIYFYPIENAQTEERAFRGGELHVTSSVPTEKIKVYHDEDANLLRIDPYLGTYYYRINVKRIKDKRVRKALALALDRKIIVENITKGGQIPAFNFTPPNTAGFTATATLEHDQEKAIAEAKKLLAEAGHPNGDGLPPVKILYNTSESHQKIAVGIQQMWKKIGIKVELENQEWKVYLKTQRLLDYDVSRAGWIGDYPDPNTFLDMWVTDGGNNQTGFSNKQYDALLTKAQATVDKTERYKIFQKLEEILNEEMPLVPIYTYTRVYLKSPDLRGWTPNILDEHPYKHVYLSSDKDVELSKN